MATGGKVLACRAGQVAATALSGLLIARGLGPEGNGHYGLTLALVVLTAAVLNGGLGLAAVPLLRRREVNLRRMLRAQGLWILLAAGVCVGLAVAVYHTRLAEVAAAALGWDGGAVAAAAVGSVALLSFEIFFFDLLAVGRVVTGPVINLARATLQALLLGGLLAAGRLGLAGAVAAFAGAQLLAAAVVAGRLRRQARPSPSGSLLPLLKLAVRRGWVGQVSAVVSLLHLRLDLALVSAFQGAAVVGIYWVAVMVGELLWLLPGALSPVLVYSSAGTDDQATRDRTAARAVRVGFWATLLVAVPLAILARPLLVLVFGVAYTSSAPALRALLPGIVAFAPGAVLAGDFIGRGRPLWNTQASGVTLLINIACGLLLIPRHGAVGASWASTVAYLAGATVMILRFHRVTGLSPGQILLPRRGDSRA